MLGHAVYVDRNVKIGNCVKLENRANLYDGVTIEDDVFIGPYVTFTNDLYPRSFDTDWKIVPTLVKKGASIGAGLVVVCGVILGEYSMVGAGSIVTRNVPAHALVFGNPARIRGFVCICGRNLVEGKKQSKSVLMACSSCGKNSRYHSMILKESGKVRMYVHKTDDSYCKAALGEEELVAVKEVFESGSLVQGKRTRLFESEFAEYIGVKHAIGVSNGTIALDVALKALGISRGHEVVTPAFSFVASSNCILYQGAKPVFADKTQNLQHKLIGCREKNHGQNQDNS